MFSKEVKQYYAKVKSNLIKLATFKFHSELQCINLNLQLSLIVKKGYYLP